MRAGKLIAAVVTLTCWAGMPSAAHAALVPIEDVATDAVEQVDSTVTAAVTPVPAPLPEPGERHPVQEAVAPVAESAARVAQAATESLPVTAVATSEPQSEERSRQPVRHISASASAGSTESERDTHASRPQGEPGRPSIEPAAPARRPAATAPTAPAGHRAAATPAADWAPASGVPGTAASGAFPGSFFFSGGGGFALLAVSLMLAGPRLRRRLALPAAVCRPAAFLLVLERPG